MSVDAYRGSEDGYRPPSLKEGWYMPSNSRKYHYFVDGRSLCRGWGFPNYSALSIDTGNTEPQKDDCVGCFRKLVKRREKKSE
jgi:subtilase family serine protease